MRLWLFAISPLWLAAGCSTLQTPPYTPDPCYIALKGAVIQPAAPGKVPGAYCSVRTDTQLIDMDGWVCFDPHDYAQWLQDMKR